MIISIMWNFWPQTQKFQMFLQWPKSCIKPSLFFCFTKKSMICQAYPRMIQGRNPGTPSTYTFRDRPVVAMATGWSLPEAARCDTGKVGDLESVEKVSKEKMARNTHGSCNIYIYISHIYKLYMYYIYLYIYIYVCVSVFVFVAIYIYASYLWISLMHGNFYLNMLVERWNSMVHVGWFNTMHGCFGTKYGIFPYFPFVFHWPFLEFMRRVSWKKATSFKLDLTVIFLIELSFVIFWKL